MSPHQTFFYLPSPSQLLCTCFKPDLSVRMAMFMFLAWLAAPQPLRYCWLALVAALILYLYNPHECDVGRLVVDHSDRSCTPIANKYLPRNFLTTYYFAHRWIGQTNQLVLNPTQCLHFSWDRKNCTSRSVATTLSVRNIIIFSNEIRNLIRSVSVNYYFLISWHSAHVRTPLFAETDLSPYTGIQVFTISISVNKSFCAKIKYI